MRKIVNNKGFTLVEMLACIVVLLMISAICNTGMNFALTSYQQSIFESDSQMLEDTLDMYIGDILRHATEIKPDFVDVDDATMVEVTEFTNLEYQIYNGNFVLQEKQADTGIYYLGYTSIKDGVVSYYKVAGESVYANSLYIDDWELEYNVAKGIFTGSYKIRSRLLENASRECSFTFRTIASY